MQGHGFTQAGAMKIEHISEPGREWDDFVDGRQEANLGHAAVWAGILRRAYGLTPHYLQARDETGAMAGVLPLAEIRDLRGGRGLVSLPFLDVAGPLAVDPAVARALIDHALELTVSTRARELELRSLVGGAETAAHPDRVDLVLELESDPDAQWSALRAKVRNQVRKAEKEGLMLQDSSPQELLDAFYATFAVNMRDLGSPVHSRGFFEEIQAAFGERARLIVTALDGRPVGGLMAIHFGDTVTVPWASTLRSERRRCPNNQIYWEAIRWAITRGASRLDFGRSPRESGTHRFKLGWGARERELAWSGYRADGSSIDLAAPGDSSIMSGLSRAWMRLPVPIATWLGPMIRRRIAS